MIVIVVIVGTLRSFLMEKIKENQDLEQMFRGLASIWAKRSMMISEHEAEDANGFQFGWMPWEGSSDSSASTLSQMDEYIIGGHVRRCSEFSRGECAPLTICRCRGCLWPARHHDTTVAGKLALVSRATRATCIFGISGALIDMFVFAQFEGFSAWERIARAARKM